MCYVLNGVTGYAPVNLYPLPADHPPNDEESIS